MPGPVVGNVSLLGLKSFLCLNPCTIESRDRSAARSIAKEGIMKKIVFIAIFVLSGALVSACVTEATEKEYKDMCENLVRLRGKIDTTPLDEVIARIEKEYQNRAKIIKEQLDREVMAWDELFKADLSSAKDEKEKEKLLQEDEEFRASAKRKYAEQLEELNPRKQKDVRRAKERAEEAQLDWAEAVDQCLSTSQQERIPQKTAQCRISAETTDMYWNTCR